MSQRWTEIIPESTYGIITRRSREIVMAKRLDNQVSKAGYFTVRLLAGTNLGHALQYSLEEEICADAMV